VSDGIGLVVDWVYLGLGHGVCDAHVVIITAFYPEDVSGNLFLVHAFQLGASPSLNEGNIPNDSLHPPCNSNNDIDEGE